MKILGIIAAAFAAVTCVGKDGVYIAQDGANGPEVVPNDPACVTP